MTSDKGIVRQTNQDSCYVSLFDENSCLAIVCDGMGGSNGGDIASDMAVKTISERITGGWRTGISIESIKNLLTTAISAANICIFDEAGAEEKLKGMGTTVVAAVIKDDDLIICHVGDSRAYIAGNNFMRVTKDHSLVQSLIDSGEITEAQAEYYPYKNVITRALGIDEHIDIDFAEFKIKEKQKVLLCSDGLTNYVSENDLFKIINENDTSSVSDVLVKAANLNGGGDNITAIVIEK